MMFSFNLLTPNGGKTYEIDLGTSMFFVGANGSGKTRLSVMIERNLGVMCHRISAHRALSLNPHVSKISNIPALNSLRHGSPEYNTPQHRDSHRWDGKAETALLNDFDKLLQVLFAEQAITHAESHKNSRAKIEFEAKPTNFEKLSQIWQRVLPHRQLNITGDDITCINPSNGEEYSASRMSDGERAVFYLIGQTLAAIPNSVLIFDEPELHIHRGILSRLWDEIEAARQDCAIIVISHDLEFVASREGKKYVLHEYSAATGCVIEEVPENTGFSEELTTQILGSRKPILFVEGIATSLDKALYRACYPKWTIIARQSCEEVIHAVITMRANNQLTRVECAGIVDADDYTSSEIEFLTDKGIGVLPVSEIENLFLLPEVIEAIARIEGHTGASLTSVCQIAVNEIIAHAKISKNQQDCVLQYCRRRIDRILKRIDLSQSSDVQSLTSDYRNRTNALDVPGLARQIIDAIDSACSTKDIPLLLKWYSNKGLINIAATAKGTSNQLFKAWLVRSLNNDAVPTIRAIIQPLLPNFYLPSASSEVSALDAQARPAQALAAPIAS